LDRSPPAGPAGVTPVGMDLRRVGPLADAGGVVLERRWTPSRCGDRLGQRLWGAAQPPGAATAGSSLGGVPMPAGTPRASCGVLWSRRLAGSGNLGARWHLTGAFSDFRCRKAARRRSGCDGGDSRAVPTSRAAPLRSPPARPRSAVPACRDRSLLVRVRGPGQPARAVWHRGSRVWVARGLTLGSRRPATFFGMARVSWRAEAL
jgi:hypothetical protein